MRKMSRICFHPFLKIKRIYTSAASPRWSANFAKTPPILRFFGDIFENDHQKVISQSIFFATFELVVGFHHLSFSKALRPELPLWQTGCIQKSLFKKSPKI